MANEGKNRMKMGTSVWIMNGNLERQPRKLQALMNAKEVTLAKELNGIDHICMFTVVQLIVVNDWCSPLHNGLGTGAVVKS